VDLWLLAGVGVFGQEAKQKSYKMHKAYLIRHCEPEVDPTDRIVGRTNPVLSQRGRQQAISIRLWYPEISHLPVWTSPLLRALQTAEIAFPKSNLRIEPLASERDFGVLENLTLPDAYNLYPEAMKSLMETPLSFVPNGGEGWDDVFKRARSLIPQIFSGTSVVLVSHRLFLCALVCELTKQPLNGLLDLDWGHGGCMVIEYQLLDGETVECKGQGPFSLSHYSGEISALDDSDNDVPIVV
jgi:broad specificity phosphatase PhoE